MSGNATRSIRLAARIWCSQRQLNIEHPTSTSRPLRPSASKQGEFLAPNVLLALTGVQCDRVQVKWSAHIELNIGLDESDYHHL